MFGYSVVMALSLQLVLQPSAICWQSGHVVRIVTIVMRLSYGLDAERGSQVKVCCVSVTVR